MFAWTQSELPLFDPTEPRVLPQDRGAWFTINWLSPEGRLNRQKAFEVDELETVLRLIQGQPNAYMSQCFLDRPIRRHPFVLYGTHAYVDLDTYRIPSLAGLSLDAQAREVQLRCDDCGIPQPSALIASGRGLYGKWYWTCPVGPDGVGAMIAVNRGIQRKMAVLGADPKATDATRILRITGTEHTGAKRMVELLHLEQRDGHTVTYEFDAFARQIAPGTNDRPTADLLLPPVADMDREARTQRGGRMFTREGWHWAIVEDCYALARLRWGGIVPKGSRDIFGHVIACQLARIFRPETLYQEIIAAVSRTLPPHYIARDLANHCSTLMRNAREAVASGDWTKVYRYRKASLIDLLEITPAEERHMRALISDAEKRRREMAREAEQRRAAGMIERAEYEAASGQRRIQAVVMRAQGMSLRAIGAALGVSHEHVRRYLRG
jgi:hypothetical protein